MQGPTRLPPDFMTAAKIFGAFLHHYTDEWRYSLSGSQEHPTNSAALEYVLDQYNFRMRDINKIILFGLRDPGTHSEQRASYYGQALTDDQQTAQRVNITRLGIARHIQEYIRLNFPQNGAVSLYVCEGYLSEYTKARLRDLGATAFVWDGLPDYINQNSLVYDVTRNPEVFRRDVEFSWEGAKVPPAVVLTRMDSVEPYGELDK
ncbi:hypothetical protein INS49_012907 [Diaporthe citri]|uniref:uncharacterized protein n=1 Tax=Diaporthe citri TaxID=83186 RepID=UPI001C81F821|nr:uncharacterized protein INS49_012907 [Diaporthe citri]KAG6359386.1 hypothetical protein INS49_012907 [Diaporthe citri]